MLFTSDAHHGLVTGEIDLTFRAWKRPQVKVGGTYCIRSSPEDIWLAVDSLDQVRVDTISESESRRAGQGDLTELQARLRRADPGLGDKSLVFRVAFHRVSQPDEEAGGERLTKDDVALISSRLARLEKNRQPWTRRVLQLIADNPEMVSTGLAASIGQERFAFKDDVRKLKKLGLTESLRIGYRLSGRGAQFMRLTNTGEAADPGL